MGSDKVIMRCLKKKFELETGKAYRLEISSMGFKEYEIEAEDFFRNIWIREIEVNGIDDTQLLMKLNLKEKAK